jgi:uncharacterized DUF497 family protein
MEQGIITAIWNPSFVLAILLPCRTTEVEWSEQKRHTNIAKQGVDFVAATRVFDGPILEVEDRRRDYGEMRFLALGEVAGQVICSTLWVCQPAPKIASWCISVSANAACRRFFRHRRRRRRR